MRSEHIIKATCCISLVEDFLNGIQLGVEVEDPSERQNIINGLENLKTGIAGIEIRIDEILKSIGMNASDVDGTLTLLNSREDGDGKVNILNDEVEDVLFSNDPQVVRDDSELDEVKSKQNAILEDNNRSDIEKISNLTDGLINKTVKDGNWNIAVNWIRETEDKEVKKNNIYKLWKLFISLEIFSKNFEAKDLNQKYVVFRAFNTYTNLLSHCIACNDSVSSKDLATHIKTSSHVQNLEKYWESLEDVEFDFHSFVSFGINSLSCKACAEIFEECEVRNHSKSLLHLKNLKKYFTKLNMSIDLEFNCLSEVDMVGLWFECKVCDDTVKIDKIVAHCKLDSHNVQLKSFYKKEDREIDWEMHTFYSYSSDNVRCDACNRLIYGLYEHSRSSIHCRKVDFQKIGINARKNHTVYEYGNTANGEKIVCCVVCSVFDIKDFEVLNHINGKSHEKKIKLFKSLFV